MSNRVLDRRCQTGCDDTCRDTLPGSRSRSAFQHRNHGYIVLLECGPLLPLLRTVYWPLKDAVIQLVFIHSHRRLTSVSCRQRSLLYRARENLKDRNSRKNRRRHVKQEPIFQMGDFAPLFYCRFRKRTWSNVLIDLG